LFVYEIVVKTRSHASVAIIIIIIIIIMIHDCYRTQRYVDIALVTLVLVVFQTE